MPTGPRRRPPDAARGPWLGLSEASALLGVSPATLRRWSDAGRVPAFTTPGGHRRYARSALERLLPAEHARPRTNAVGGLTPQRIARAYRRRAGATGAGAPWLVALSDEDRERFRDAGREIVDRLLHVLDADAPRTRADRLREAAESAAGYGRLTSAAGLSLAQAVEGFLRFRAPFMAELAALSRQRGLDGTQSTALLQAAERAMDHLLVATMTGHTVAAAAPPNARDGTPR
jgi:excisionase family DNA binding protein